MSRALLRAPWCHQELSRSLFSINAIPISRHTPLQSVSKTNSRAFTSVSRLRSDQPSDSPNANKPTETKETASENEPPTQSSSHVPWYLREEAPISESREISSRDQIPALPEDPPAILSDVLEYTFKDLGLDELKLIDLRGLETPAALGANVIMIIGTARSVKHLNVSADRMCRWLRSTYKLSPYADGLLGRNELKIKLRRKARRARLASRSGAMFDDKDDGITTGWICVNAGVVEETPVQEQQVEGFEGFGKSFRGTRIVVQMFTEEKRADVDLETLWERALERAEREKQRFAAKVASEASEASSEDMQETPSDTISEEPKGPVARSSVNFPFQQTRRFHSTRRFMEGQPAQTAKQPNATTPSNNDAFIRIPDLEPLSEEQVLKELRSTCAALSTETTPKLKKKLFLTFSHCVASGYEVPDELGIDVFAGLLPGPAQAEHTTRDKNLAFRVLDYLSLRGTNILTMKVLNVLYKAAVYEAQGNKEEALRNARQVSTVLETFDMPFDPAEARKFMVASFQNRDYNGFWHMWRKLPMNNSPRTFDDYTTLFKLHADLGEEVRAQECVSTWAPMMKREEPPVPLEGALRQSLMDCLVLADPDIAQTAEAGSPGDLARIWRECHEME